MEFELTKIDAAVDQLDWAIRLFLDYRAYVAAITLAAAAEEILGKPLAEHAAANVLKKKFASEYSLAEKAITQNYLNKAKNWLKHWNELVDDEKITLELDTEAIQYIVRALANLMLHDGSGPSEGPRFAKWLKENRPDLETECGSKDL
jgi:viroplasmin and RNaseH domain-containing protein